MECGCHGTIDDGGDNYVKGEFIIQGFKSKNWVMGQDDLTLTVEDNWVAAEDMEYTVVVMILFVQVLFWHKCILSYCSYAATALGVSIEVRNRRQAELPSSDRWSD